MLERDDFAARYKANQPISVHELLYPLAQGYDSVALKCDVELGGTDQKFNLLVGREIQREYGQPAQIVLTTPILEGLDGVQKMSKTFGNYIGITEPPAAMFAKVMSISDELMYRYYELLTDMSLHDISEMKQAAARGKRHPMELKKELGERIVRDFHGADSARAAREEWVRVHSQGQLPTDVERVELSNHPLIERDGRFLLKLTRALVAAGLASSVSDAQRKIKAGSVRIDGERRDQLIYWAPSNEPEILIQVGKASKRVKFGADGRAW
jgi:tyrosyl-tRNA synthetase